jgi:DNA-binding transcriptional ArsR family regulator
VAAVASVSKAVASYHLRLLYRMGLASYRKDGRLVYYSLAAHDVVPVVDAALKYALARPMHVVATNTKTGVTNG